MCWLRWATLDGTLLPTPQEVAAKAQRQAMQAQRQLAEAQRQAEALNAWLARYRERFGDPP